MKQGRPKIAPELKRTALAVRLSPDEREVLDAVAREDGLDVSTWMRVLALKEAKRRRGESNLRTLAPPHTHLQRTPTGEINNCALANGATAKSCQMCKGDCPDKERFV